MITALRHMTARIRAFFASRELDHDFDEEMESHLAMLIEDNIRSGMPAEQARRKALVRMGGRASLREQHRQVRSLPLVESVLQDLGFAIRLLLKERWFSTAAIVALALGIGVNTVGFTIVNAAFLRGLPFDDASRLYMLLWRTQTAPRNSLSNAEFRDLQAQTRTFSGIAGHINVRMNISDEHGWPEEVRSARLTANTFGVLRQRPLMGRDFESQDETKGAQPVVIIGYSLWENRYAADSNILGKLLRVNGETSTIIGVMPEGMKFPDNTDLWLPFIPTTAEEQPRIQSLNVFGRLKDGTDRRQVQTELNGIAQRLAQTYPELGNRRLIGALVQTFTERFVGGPARVMFLVMMGAVTLVLLIACANVANLLLSRSAHRTREIAMRMALGATRWRVVRQLLIESIVLGSIGGAIGLGLAVAGVSLFDSAVQDPGKPYWIVFAADRLVFAYVAGLCVLTAIIFGLVPALQVSKSNTNDILKDGGHGTAGSRRMRRLRGGIVVAQLALSLVLLAGAGLMFRSFMNLYSLDIGFATDHLLTSRMQLPLSKYATPAARLAFYETLHSRLAGVPGIESVALTTGVPPLNGGERELEADGSRPESRDRLRFVSTATISPQYFDVLGVRLLRGRSFNDTDGAPGLEAVIVNEQFAREFFRGQDPLGKRIRFAARDPLPGAPPPVWRTIIGVSPSIRQGSVQNAYLDSVVYIPARQDVPAAASIIVRSALPSVTVMDALRREVQAIDPDQPVFLIQTMDQVLADSRWPYRVFGSLFATFAIIALMLSSVGLYAVMAYSVSQQTREIGVRMALGARRSQVSWLVLKRGIVQLAIGLALGLAGALGLSRALSGVLVDVTARDPLTFAAITIILSIVSIGACLLPALRATRIDPLNALRTE